MMPRFRLLWAGEDFPLVALFKKVAAAVLARKGEGVESSASGGKDKRRPSLVHDS